MLKNKLNIASLNVCLGLANKKDIIEDLISKENIDILCLQESEITNLNFDCCEIKNYDIKESEIRVLFSSFGNIRSIDMSQEQGTGYFIILYYIIFKSISISISLLIFIL